MNIEELKQKLVDHLAKMDMDNMSMDDLHTYADIVRTANDMFKPDVFAEALKIMSEKTFAPPAYGIGCMNPDEPTKS